MDVSKFKSYFVFDGENYILIKDIKQCEIDLLYYQIALNRRIPYTEYLDIIDVITSEKYRKDMVEHYFNEFYIK